MDVFSKFKIWETTKNKENQLNFGKEAMNLKLRCQECIIQGNFTRKELETCFV